MIIISTVIFSYWPGHTENVDINKLISETTNAAALRHFSQAEGREMFMKWHWVSWYLPKMSLQKEAWIKNSAVCRGIAIDDGVFSSPQGQIDEIKPCTAGHGSKLIMAYNTSGNVQIAKFTEQRPAVRRAQSSARFHYCVACANTKPEYIQNLTNTSFPCPGERKGLLWQHFHRC